MSEEESQLVVQGEPESVWDYPRPPRLESSARHLRILHAGVLLADTKRSFRILETSHPPVFYIPQVDIAMEWLRPSTRHGSFCEFKGVASYWSIDLTAAAVQSSASLLFVEDAAWSYAQPSCSYAALANYVAFYANHVDECTVDEERVRPQPGDFYGGWITSHLKGPFKGAPGTRGW